MSSIKIVIAKLLSESSVTDLVGNDIWFKRMPQNKTLPAILVRLVGSNDTVSLAKADKYYRDKVQVEILAQDVSGKFGSDATADIGDVVKDVLNGVIKQTIAGSVDVDIIFADIDFDDDYNDKSFSDRRVQQYSVRWRNA